MKIFRSINIRLLLIVISAAILSTSCKKSKEVTPNKPIVLVNDTITKDGFTIIFINQDSTFQVKGDTLRKAYEKAFFITYPKICAYFNPDGQRVVPFIVDDAFKAQQGEELAYASGGEIHINPVYALAAPNDLNVLVHELTHIDQAYSAPNTPGWMTEGIAEYSRNKFGIPGRNNGWYIPDYWQGQKYTDGYTVIARFLLWAEAKYQPGIAQYMDKQLRAGTYDDDASWQAETGITFSQLWTSYTENPYY